MSTTETERPVAPAALADGRPSNDWPTAVIPAVPVRRSILHPAPRDEGAPFSARRSPAETEELPAVPAPRRRTVARHLRAALIGTLLAIVAISGLSAYAAAGITDARQAALDHARSHVSAPR